MRLVQWLRRVFGQERSGQERSGQEAAADLEARPYPGPWSVDADPGDLDGFRKALARRNRAIEAWDALEAERVRLARRCRK